VAISDYICCSRCETKLIYDGDQGNRRWWKEQFGSEVNIKCPKCEWIGLTDGEIEECKINGGLPHAINWRLSVKVMEAKLKEKNCVTS
jgi:hypothetical protein